MSVKNNKLTQVYELRETKKFQKCPHGMHFICKSSIVMAGIFTPLTPLDSPQGQELYVVHPCPQHPTSFRPHGRFSVSTH